MTPFEVRRLPKDEVIISTPSLTHPLRCKKWDPDKFDWAQKLTLPANDLLEIDETACDCGRSELDAATVPTKAATAKTQNGHTEKFNIELGGKLNSAVNSKPTTREERQKEREQEREKEREIKLPTDSSKLPRIPSFAMSVQQKEPNPQSLCLWV
jgi:hypothetical protein